MGWSEEWEMKFNVNKCKVKHFGYNNPSYKYLMNDEVLIDTEEETDLCVTWIPNYGIRGSACLVFRSCRLWLYVLYGMPFII